jgi:hypothetical protein
MQYRCQKNYIILMTDGDSTQDQDSKLTSGTYINGDTIGDYDNDGNDTGVAPAPVYSSGGSDYLNHWREYTLAADSSQRAAKKRSGSRGLACRRGSLLPCAPITPDPEEPGTVVGAKARAAAIESHVDTSIKGTNDGEPR